jgi:hypothetical protein
MLYVRRVGKTYKQAASFYGRQNNRLQRAASIAIFSSIMLKMRLKAVCSARLNQGVRWLHNGERYL